MATQTDQPKSGVKPVSEHVQTLSDHLHGIAAEFRAYEQLVEKHMPTSPQVREAFAQVKQKVQAGRSAAEEEFSKLKAATTSKPDQGPKQERAAKSEQKKQPEAEGQAEKP
jgi:hypothetical protein